MEDAKQLEEVVVTAYGSGQKKASMVGSVQAIRPAELQVPSASLSNSLAGRCGNNHNAISPTGTVHCRSSSVFQNREAINDFWVKIIQITGGYFHSVQYNQRIGCSVHCRNTANIKIRVGATVRVKDVNSGVITDMDGKFTIKATPGDVLVISYIGYETKEVKVVNGKVLLVELVEDAKQLEEVVVTAYGSGQKKGPRIYYTSYNLYFFLLCACCLLFQFQDDIISHNYITDTTSGKYFFQHIRDFSFTIQIFTR